MVNIMFYISCKRSKKINYFSKYLNSKYFKKIGLY